ncbi:MFS transporter [Streptacidiphilus monticola]
MGLILGGLLTSLISWRWVMFINVPFGLAVSLLAPRVVQEPERHPGRLDVPGAALATTGTAALVYGFIRAARDWADPLALGSFAAAALLLSGFVLVELRTERPLLPLGLLATRVRAGGYAAMALVAAAMFGMFFFVTQYLQVVLGYSAMRAGLAFLPLTVPLFAAARTVPRLVPRWGPGLFLLTGPLLIGAGMLLLTRLGPDSRFATGVLPALLLFGFGAGSTMAPLSLTILHGVRPEESGAASGTLQTMQQVGGALGTAVLLTAFSAAEHPGPAGFAHGVAVAMGWGALAVGLAWAVLALVVRPRGRLE